MASFDLPAIADVAQAGASQLVPLDFAPVTARSLRLVVDEYRAARPRAAARRSTGQTLPVSFTEVTLPGVAQPAAPTARRGRRAAPTSCASTARRCRCASPVHVGRRPHRTRSLAPAATTRRRRWSLDLDAGSHTVTTATGLDLGIDVDRVVLSSDRRAATPTRLRRAVRRSTPRAPR